MTQDTTTNEAKRKPRTAKKKPATKRTGTKTKPQGKAKRRTDDEMSGREIAHFCAGVLLLLVAVFLMVAILSFFFTGSVDQQYIEGKMPHATNWMGGLGALAADFLVTKGYGVAGVIWPVFGAAIGVRVLGLGHVRLWKWFVNCGLLILLLSMLGGTLEDSDWYRALNTHISFAGTIGHHIYTEVHDRIGGFYIVLLIVLFLCYLTYLSRETIRICRLCITKPVDIVRGHIKEKPTEPKTEEEKEEEALPPLIEEEEAPREETPAPPAEEHTATTIDFDITEPVTPTPTALLDDVELTVVTAEEEEAASETPAPQGMTVTEGEPLIEATPTETGELEPYDPKLDLENYHYPTLDLLKRYTVESSVDMDEQQANKNQILTVLANFGVEISSIKATVGPTITLYEVTPAPGVRINKIRNLEDDIALSLRALGIRIIAPIPGKGTIGIEVPNARPQIVSMESIINSRKFQECEYELPIALGKTITNDVFLVDLAKMPHLLVAGATGQGKSVGLNAIITSLLYKKHPAELKLVMVDPKKVEFSVYNPIVHHFLAQVEGNEDAEEPIICDVTKVIETLKSLCVEMDTRYDLLKRARARNIKEYNQKFRDRQLNPQNGHKFMPYIVVVIDEFGDLIMTAGKEIELPIARIAQLARAVGIHMIIATQRPTTNIITGTIKANFPARMAFKVSAMVDSRTILDRPGANQLVGKGDMLFLAGNEPVRVQCAFVDTPEIERIVAHIAAQQSYMAPFPLPPVPLDGDDSAAADVDLGNLDPMFEEVARMVVGENSGSTSMIQRKFSIGYNRAGRLMDQLEKAGIVGPAKGSKPREVLCVGEEDLQMKLSALQ